MPSVILTRLFSFAVTFWRCKVHVFQAHAPSISRQDAKSLLLFGGWVTITAVVGPLMTVLDRFVDWRNGRRERRHLLHGAVPAGGTLHCFAGGVDVGAFPRFASASSVERRELATLAIRSLAAVMTPVIVIALLLVDPFFSAVDQP